MSKSNFISTCPKGARCLGCASIFLHLVLIFASTSSVPLAVIATTNAPICEGSDLFLFESGGSAVSWAWSGPAGFSPSNQNPVIPNATPSNAGIYMVMVTDAIGCSATQTVNVMVTPVTMEVCNGLDDDCDGQIDEGLGLTYQAPGILWQNTIGGSAHDGISAAQQTSDGGYIIGGISRSDISGDKTENALGPPLLVDYWVVKLDGNGNIQWQNTIGGANGDALTSLQQTNDGGYILGGNSASDISGDKTENSQGGTDYWIVKLDAGGNILWQNTIGGSNNDDLHSLQQTADGGYILGGSSASSISGDKTENSQGDTDYWVIKLDGSGNIQWQNTIGGTLPEKLYSVHQTNDGGYILGGNSASDVSGDKTENSQGASDYWVIKLDGNGNIIWQNTIGGANFESLNSIRQTSDGGYILAGESLSDASGDKTENSQGGVDYWVIKLNGSGNILWQNTIGGSAEDAAFSIQPTNDGGYVLCGSSFSPISGDKTENPRGFSDYWMVRLDANGNILWDKTLGGSSWDYALVVNQTSDGGFFLAGTSDYSFSGDKTENGQGIFDYWVIKLGPETITGATEICDGIDNDCDGLIDEDAPVVTLAPFSLVCLNASPFTLTGGSPVGGTYSGPGVSTGQFNPATAGVGTHTITYSFTDANNCTGSGTQVITVNSLPTVTVANFSPVCLNTAAFPLTAGSPAGGTYTGTGVSAGQFNPATAGVGTHTITYSFTDANNCTGSGTQVITVNSLPTVTIANFSPVCLNAAAFPLTGGSPAGGTYTGTGVSAGQFNPATAGVGAHTITYSYTDGNGCSNSSVNTIQVIQCCPSGNVLFVNYNAAGANNGTSWTDAYTDLQSALASACPGITQIWVAAGTYMPTATANRSIYFVMKNNLAIYGGFNGTETLLSQRNWVSNVTILSGDIGAAGSIGDNSYHVIFNSNLNNTAVLDGFTIKEGNSNQSPNSGGGMYNLFSSPILTNCTFSGNSATDGSGLYNYSSSPILTNCAFSSNSASNDGGGVYNYLSSPSLTNCTFSGNSAGSKGGGMVNHTSTPSLTNCLFSGNSAALSGGGMFSILNPPNLTNCTFSGNSASIAGGMHNVSTTTATLKNCIFWGNSSGVVNQGGASATYTKTAVQGLNLGGGVFNGNTNPLFVNQPNFNNAPTTAGDLRLQGCSPAIDVGTNTGVPLADLDGNPRPKDGDGNGTATTDPGAFEYQGVMLTWYKDKDNDGYSDGTTLVQCTQPGGYKLVSNLLAIPTGAGIDCQDGPGSVTGYPNASKANIHPNALELCNGIDDDCDGVIDLGVPGGQTYNTGNVLLNTQAKVNDWPSCYTKIVGNLTISTAGVTNLAALSNLTEVTGNVTIQSTSLANLSGLNNLTAVGSNLTIRQNNGGLRLTTLDGLQGVTSVGGDLKVRQNNSLTDCCPIELLLLHNGVAGNTTINNNLTPCNSASQILGACPLFVSGGNGDEMATPDCPDCPTLETVALYEIFIFPNPTSGTLTLEFMGAMPRSGTLQVLDIYGRKPLTETLLPGRPTHSFSLAALPAGMYFVQVLDDGQPAWLEKIVKQ